MTDPLSFFKESFSDSRASFLDLASHAGGEHLTHPVPSKGGSELSFDSLYLPPMSGRKKRLLVLTSGIHGIEGYTGSALQRYLLAHDFFGLRDDDLGVLIIHGINPYGFEHKRRVTENNVDLNRNFDVSSELFQTKNDGYDKVYSFLNPQSRRSKAAFYVSAISNILKYGVNTLRRAILQGQYQHQDGIFFGGKDFEPQVALIKNEVQRVGQGFEKVLLIDLHTGYGQRNSLHLFGNTSPFIDPKFMDVVFEDLSVDYGEEKDFYEVTGGFTIFLAKLFHEKAKYAGICFEFGTIDSQKLSGSLDSLYRMINENQSDATDDDKKMFREMFYPSSLEWRKAVVEQFEATLTTVLKNFSSAE